MIDAETNMFTAFLGSKTRFFLHNNGEFLLNTAN